MPIRRSRRSSGSSSGRPTRDWARLLVFGGATLTVLGVVLFGGALVVLGPLPDTLAGFIQRWADARRGDGVRGAVVRVDRLEALERLISPRNR